MKIRNGFVSNSSSSSFVCKIKDITNEEIEKLIDYGFQHEVHFFASQVEHAGQYEAAGLDTTNTLSIHVPCNEEEVMDFLTQNNIPFSGCCHYGHYNVFFKRGEKWITQVENVGMRKEMYGLQTDTELIGNMLYENNNWEYSPFTFIKIEELHKDVEETNKLVEQLEEQEKEENNENT